MWRASASTTSKYMPRRLKTTRNTACYDDYMNIRARAAVLCTRCILANISSPACFLVPTSVLATAAACAWLTAGHNTDLRIIAPMGQVIAEPVRGASDATSDVKYLGGGKHQEEGATDVLHGLLGHVFGQHIAAQDG